MNESSNLLKLTDWRCHPCELILVVGLVIQNPGKGNAADGFTFENGFREVDEIYVGSACL
jgi:hypothetical protein